MAMFQMKMVGVWVSSLGWYVAEYSESEISKVFKSKARAPDKPPRPTHAVQDPL